MPFNIRNKLKDFLDNKVDNAEIIAVQYGIQASYKLLAIHIAASYIANALSKCEYRFFEENEPVKDFNYYRMNIEPNKNYNGSRFWNKAIMKMLTNPDGSLIILHNNEMFVCDDFQIDKYPLIGNMYTSIVVDDLSMFKSFKEHEVLHLQLEDTNVIKYINGMYEDYGKAISYAAKSYQKSNGEKYKLKVMADKIGDLSFEDYYNQKLKSQLKEFLENGSGIYPENKGYSLEEFKNRTQTKDSSDLVSLRKDIFSAIGQAYKIPQSMMEGNINNMQEVVKAFLTFAVEPVARLIDDELNRKLCGYEAWKKGSKYKINTNSIPYVSILENATNAGALIGNTICMPEELRDIFGLDHIDKEFLRTFFATKNNSKAEDLLYSSAENGKE